MLAIVVNVSVCMCECLCLRVCVCVSMNKIKMAVRTARKCFNLIEGPTLPAINLPIKQSSNQSIRSPDDCQIKWQTPANYAKATKKLSLCAVAVLAVAVDIVCPA